MHNKHNKSTHAHTHTRSRTLPYSNTWDETDGLCCSGTHGLPVAFCGSQLNGNINQVYISVSVANKSCRVTHKGEKSYHFRQSWGWPLGLQPQTGPHQKTGSHCSDRLHLNERPPTVKQQPAPNEPNKERRFRCDKDGWE